MVLNDLSETRRGNVPAGVDSKASRDRSDFARELEPVSELPASTSVDKAAGSSSPAIRYRGSVGRAVAEKARPPIADSQSRALGLQIELLLNPEPEARTKVVSYPSMDNAARFAR